MNFDDHPYLLGYLIGSAVAVLLGVFVVIETLILGWLFKGNILQKNLNKIKDPETYGFKVNAGLFVFGLFTGALMSWLGVLQYLWQIIWTPIRVLRELLSSTPEEIKTLRFPLMNNPELSREAVYAYAYALGVKAGAIPSSWQIAQELKDIEGFYPSFNPKRALESLKSLGVIEQETMSEALAELDSIECMRKAGEAELLETRSVQP